MPKLIDLITIGVILSFASCTVEHQPDEGTNPQPDDFIKSAKAEITGNNIVKVDVTFSNPTDEKVCIYEGLLSLADVVSANKPDRVLTGLEDDPNQTDPRLLIQGGFGESPITHERKKLLKGKKLFWPGIEVEPGEQFSFSQIRDYGQHVVLFGDARDGVGLESYPATVGQYRIAFRGLQIFRCGLLDDQAMAQVAAKVLSFEKFSSVSKHNPDGIFWRYSDFVKGESFSLDLSPPPKGWSVTVYD